MSDRSLGRKGTNFELVFICALLVGILIIGIALYANSSGTQYERRAALSDFAHEKASAALISLMRQNVDSDLNGDGSNDPASLADAIVAGTLTRDSLASVLDARIAKGVVYVMTIKYSNGTVIDVSRGDELLALPGNAIPPSVRLLLPKGVVVDFTYADREVFRAMSEIGGADYSEAIDIGQDVSAQAAARELIP